MNGNDLQNRYYFDFNDVANEQLPLTQKILKVCKNEIKELELVGIYSNSQDNKIKITNEKINSIHSKQNLFNSNKINIITTLFNDIKFNFILKKDKIVFNIDKKLGFSNINLNPKAYYIINDRLYVSYKNSFILLNNDVFKRELEISKTDLNSKILYKNTVLDTYANINLFNLTETILTKLILKFHLLYLKSLSKNRLDFRLKQTSWGFYNDVYNNNLNLFLGLKFFWKGLKFWSISLILGLSAIYYLMYVRLLPFNKIVFSWILVSMFLYWLLSGFVFFVKKYQFGKFTSVIQRFWKRTYIIFWLIEISTFSVFFYLTINSSSEPVYMYDQIKIYKTHLFSWRFFLIKLLPSTLVILLGYYLLLTLKWNLFNKQNTVMLLITLLLLYVLWLEFYQFFHIISFFGNINWSFDYDEYIWTLDIDTRRTRLANNYVAICLMLKFWHYVFIFLFWVFFILRVNELGRIRYPLLVANVQNFIIIYMMSWAYMYPWFKFVFRKYLDVPYYWFYTNGRDLGTRVFFTDLKLFYYGLTNKVFGNLFSLKFERYPFFYWINSSPLTSYSQYRKSIIRDSIINSFNAYII